MVGKVSQAMSYYSLRQRHSELNFTFIVNKTRFSYNPSKYLSTLFANLIWIWVSSAFWLILHPLFSLLVSFLSKIFLTVCKGNLCTVGTFACFPFSVNLFSENKLLEI